jgi:signal transduction histidine kinase
MSQEFLKRLPLFSGLAEEDLDRLYQMAESAPVQAGDVLMQEGSPGEALYVVLEGTFEVTKRSGQQEVVIASCKPGEVLGEISLLEQAPRSATVRALTSGRVLKISQASFQQLLALSPSAALDILRMVTTRLKETQSMLRQSEKMAALGTLSAGLAHELNNPAAALRRSVAQLRESLLEWQRLTAELAGINFEPNQKQVIGTLHAEAQAGGVTPAPLDALDRSDREDSLQIWLEAQGVDEAWELAPVLVSLGWEVSALEELARHFSAEQFQVLVRWLGVGGAVHMLLGEAGMSAERISEIVRAVKNYSYLDQAPIQEVDVREGLENTLVILRHKAAQGVRIVRDYAPDLPRIEAYAPELNQVWTNLIDNALDALNGEGELLLRAYAQDGQVVIEICDDGPGIPPDVQPRIFEPFFTTKPPGVGNGLGLHIVYNIVAEKHHGQIQVTSRPGHTCFRITLPTHMRQA